MKKFKDIIKIIIIYLKRSPIIISSNAFVSFIILIILSIIISGSIFALTIFSLNNIESNTKNSNSLKQEIFLSTLKPSIQSSKTAFKKELFLAILDIWDKKNIMLNEADIKIYEDLFQVR